MTAGKTLKGIAFAQPEGAAELLLDLYLPAAAQQSGGGSPKPSRRWSITTAAAGG